VSLWQHGFRNGFVWGALFQSGSEVGRGGLWGGSLSECFLPDRMKRPSPRQEGHTEQALLHRAGGQQGIHFKVPCWFAENKINITDVERKNKTCRALMLSAVC